VSATCAGHTIVITRRILMITSEEARCLGLLRFSIIELFRVDGERGYES